MPAVATRSRSAAEGEGFLIADVEPGRQEPTLEVTDGFWLHPRGAVRVLFWTYQRAHGRRWYERPARGRPVEGRSLEKLLDRAPRAPVTSRAA